MKRATGPSFIRTAFIVAGLLALFLPVAETLKNQNPWNCFNFTLDESYFAQAAQNWSEGKGYRIATTLPFDPTITVGIPMAWGANAIHDLTHEDIANSGRLFVYLSFILLLLVIARAAFVRDRNWFAVPLALWFFGYGLSKIPLGGYFAFGFLGETPGFLAGAFTFRALDEKKFVRAGLYAVLAFVMKPTFIFLVPAVALAALFHSRKAILRTGLAEIGALGLVFYLYASARHQGIGEYIVQYFEASSRIAHDVPAGTLVDFYGTMEPAVSYFSVAFLLFGGYAALRARRIASGTIAAFFVFVLATLYFLFLGHRPVEKQWGAILGMTLVGFSIQWGAWVAGFFRGWLSREFARAAILAIIATWVCSVGDLSLHRYLKTPETACASKEQSAINRRLRELVDRGEANPGNVGAWITEEPYTMSLYRLGFNPPYLKALKDFGPTLPKWLYGRSRYLFPTPAGCKPDFKGETFALLECEPVPISPVVPARKARSRSRSKSSTKARRS